MGIDHKTGAMPDKASPIFDPQHNDSDGKVILVSSDNVSFRVHAWYMAQKSEFIKGLLVVPSNQSLEDAPIQLNQTAEFVRKLLDFVYATGPVPVDSAKECHALLEMCDHLQMSRIRNEFWKMIEARLDAQKPDPHAFGLSPWEAFKLGATMDAPRLCYDAALALSRYGYKVDDICKQPPAAYEGIPTRYLATLLIDNYHPQPDGSYKQCSMMTVAGRFANMTSG